MELKSNKTFHNRSIKPIKTILPAETPVFNKNNPFGAFFSGGDIAFNIGNQSVKTYFDEMKRALGKDASETRLSKEDFEKYERILSNTEELLEDTIKFSERASSSSTVFRQQKQFLEERINLTNTIAGMFTECKKNATSSILLDAGEESKETKEKDKAKSRKSGVFQGIEIPFLRGLF